MSHINYIIKTCTITQMIFFLKFHHKQNTHSHIHMYVYQNSNENKTIPEKYVCVPWVSFGLKSFWKVSFSLKISQQ